MSPTAGDRKTLALPRRLLAFLVLLGACAIVLAATAAAVRFLLSFDAARVVSAAVGAVVYRWADALRRSVGRSSDTA